MSVGFAIYRLPGQSVTTLVMGECLTASRLPDAKGFVIAPFQPSERTPFVVIRPDKVESDARIPSGFPLSAGDNPPISSFESYARDFSAFQELLTSGRLRKIVLARNKAIPRNPADSLQSLFDNACALYPNAFVALFSTPLTGTWLVATPELLLKSTPDALYSTMALAGTIPADMAGLPDCWSRKNRQEQAFVADYIRALILRHGSIIEESEPYTSIAGSVAHLRTDFTFTLPHSPGQFLSELAPTPAVSGLPKDAAMSYIVGNESIDRKYYSGFCGPLNLPATSLYVSLRCMMITPDNYILYAGGGLLPESELNSEWEETEAKMSTMEKLLLTTKPSR